MNQMTQSYEIIFYINNQSDYSSRGIFKFSIYNTNLSYTFIDEKQTVQEPSTLENMFLNIKIESITELSILQIFLWQHRQKSILNKNNSIIIEQSLNLSLDSISEYWLCTPTLTVQMGFEVLSVKLDTDLDIEQFLKDYVSTFKKKYQQKNEHRDRLTNKHQIIIFSSYPQFDTYQIDLNIPNRNIYFQLTTQQLDHSLTTSILLQRLALNLYNNLHFAHLLPIIFAWNSYQLCCQDGKFQSEISLQQEIYISQQIYKTGQFEVGTCYNSFCLPIHLLQLDLFDENNFFLFQQMCDVSYLFKVEFFAAYSFCFDFDRSILSQCSRSGKSVTLHSVYYFQLLVGKKIPIYINLSYDPDQKKVQILYDKTSIDIGKHMKGIFDDLYKVDLTVDLVQATQKLKSEITIVIEKYFNVGLLLYKNIINRVKENMNSLDSYQTVFNFQQKLKLNSVEIAQDLNLYIKDLLKYDLFQFEQDIKVQAEQHNQNLSQTEVILLVDECLQQQKLNYGKCMNFVTKLTDFYYKQIKDSLSWKSLKDFIEKDTFKNQSEYRKNILKIFPQKYIQQINDKSQNIDIRLFFESHKDVYEQFIKYKKGTKINTEIESQFQDFLDHNKNSQCQFRKFLESKSKCEEETHTLDIQIQELSKQMNILKICLMSYPDQIRYYFQEQQGIDEKINEINMDVLTQNLKTIQQIDADQSFSLQLKQYQCSLIDFKKLALQFYLLNKQFQDIIDQNNLDMRNINFSMYIDNVQEADQEIYLLLLFQNKNISPHLFKESQQIFDQIATLSPNVINMKSLTDSLQHFQDSLEGIKYDTCEAQFKSALYHFILSFFNPRGIETIFWRNINLSTLLDLFNQVKTETSQGENQSDERYISPQLQDLYSRNLQNINTFSTTRLKRISLLAAGTDMAVINFIRQQQNIYQCDDSAGLDNYTLCNLLGGAQLHPSSILSRYYELNQINNQSIEQMIAQIKKYATRLTLVNIFITLIPELSGELQFLCPLVSPQILVRPNKKKDKNKNKEGGNNVNVDDISFCFNYCKQYQYFSNNQLSILFQNKNYEQLLNCIKIDKNKSQVINMKQLNFKWENGEFTQKTIIENNDINEFYQLVKVLPSQRLNSDVQYLFYYQVSQQFQKLLQSEIEVDQITLLQLFFKPQQITEIVSCYSFLIQLVSSQFIDTYLENFLRKLNLDSQYLSFYSIDQHEDQRVNYWEQLQTQFTNNNETQQLQFMILHQQFDDFINNKVQKQDYIVQAIKLASNAYHRLKDITNVDKTDQKIMKLAILVKIDFPKVSGIMISDSTSLPDYILAIFGLDSVFSNPILSFYEKYSCHIAAFESVSTKIQGTELKTVIQSSSIPDIDQISQTYYSEELNAKQKISYHNFYVNQQKSDIKTNISIYEILAEYKQSWYKPKLHQISYLEEISQDNQQFIQSWVQDQGFSNINEVNNYLNFFKKVYFDQQLIEVINTVNLNFFIQFPTINQQIQFIITLAQLNNIRRPIILSNFFSKKLQSIQCDLTIASILSSLGNFIILKCRYDYTTYQITLYGVKVKFLSEDCLVKDWISANSKINETNYLKTFKSIKLTEVQLQFVNQDLFSSDITVEDQFNLMIKNLDSLVTIEYHDVVKAVNDPQNRVFETKTVENITMEIILEYIQDYVILDYDDGIENERSLLVLLCIRDQKTDPEKIEESYSK